MHSLQRLCRFGAKDPYALRAGAGGGILGIVEFSGVERAGVLRRCHAACLLMATCFLWGSTIALAQPDPERPRDRKVAEVASVLQPPEPEKVLGAFKDVRSWVEGWEVKSGERAAAAGDLSGAVCVTLRFGGRMVGRGVELGGPGALARATKSALRDASAFFGEKGKPKNAARVTIELELAGALVPYPPSSYEDADLEIPIGIDGVGARAGEGADEKIRVVFPSMMLTMGAERSLSAGGQSPGDALAACAAFVLDDATAGLRDDPANHPLRLTKDRKVTFYRFNVSQTAQIAPGEEPVFLYRQGRVFPEREVSAAALKQWAEGLAGHLLARVRTQEGKTIVGGLYSPLSGASVPRAEIGEEALIGWALARAADSGAVGPDTAKRCGDAARAIARDLADRSDEKRRIESSPVASAAFLMTERALAIEDWPESRIAGQRAIAKVLEEPVRSASISALAACAAAGETGTLDDAGRAALPSIYKAVGVSKLASAMPWVVLAARTQEGEIGSTAILGEWRDVVYKFIMSPQDAGPDGEDLVGGVVFTGTKAPLPSAQSVRAIAGLAAMLNDARLTPKDVRAKEIARIIPCLRFLRQLMADEYCGTMYVDPLAAQWGVRNSLWDQRMAGEAGALALVALCEAVEGVERK